MTGETGERELKRSIERPRPASHRGRLPLVHSPDWGAFEVLGSTNLRLLSLIVPVPIKVNLGGIDLDAKAKKNEAQEVTLPGLES